MVKNSNVLYYVIVQICENVSHEDIQKENGEKFHTEYSNLLLEFSHSKKIITLPFLPDIDKINCITKVAIDNNCYLVDISHLGNGLDKTNFATWQRISK